MTTLEVVKDITTAIASVKSRAKDALAKGDLPLYSQLMGDLYYLQVVLVGEAEKLVQEADKMATELSKKAA